MNVDRYLLRRSDKLLVELAGFRVNSSQLSNLSLRILVYRKAYLRCDHLAVTLRWRCAVSHMDMHSSVLQTNAFPSIWSTAVTIFIHSQRHQHIRTT